MTAPLIEIDSLRIETVRDGRALLGGLSFSVNPGEFVAIIGESGSGKTLAARAILDLLPPGVRRAGGRMRLFGKDLAGLSPAQMRQVRGGEIGMVFQEPMVSLNPALTIGRQLAEGLRLHRGLGRAEIRALCLDMLARVRIADPEHCLRSFPHEFSGGMRQRIMLASVLLPKPKLLIADEPTTALDSLNQREMLDLMVELARKDDVAILLITHDLGVVARYAERVIVLDKGRMVEIGPTRDVLTRSKDPYTRQLVGSMPRPAARRPPISPDAPVLLAAERACVDYPGRPGLLWSGSPKRVVKNVDLAVRAGEILAVVGASGSGKSTFGRAALGLRPLSAGTIRFDGKDVARMSRAERRFFRKDCQLVFQDPFSSLDPRMRIGDIVGAALRHDPSVDRAERRRRAVEALAEVGLADFAERFPHQMSGGQRQRVAIARAIIGRPRLVVADEPVSALDLTIRQQILTLFQRLQKHYDFACLFITHDLHVVRQVADRVAVMSGGAIVESGPVDSVFAAPQDAYTRDLLAAAPSLDDLGSADAHF